MITVAKELLLNLGNFSNIKIIASVTADDNNFEAAWNQVNQQILEQESLEKSLRLGNPTPSEKKVPAGWKDTKDDLPF